MKIARAGGMLAMIIAAGAASAAPVVVGLADTCPAAGGALVPPAYVNAFRDQGGDARVLAWTNDLAAIEKMVEGIDLLVLCGGEDVDPARYKATRSPKCGAVNLRRDEFEWRLLDAAVRLRTPVFGICRGHQVINVYFGGTLWQDLPSEYPVKKILHRRRDALGAPVHFVTPATSGFLCRMFGTEQLHVNSSHHQAVKDLAPGFTVCATAPDGVVEAIGCDERHVYGVQFHPERLAPRSATWGRLFREILADARRSRRAER